MSGSSFGPNVHPLHKTPAINVTEQVVMREFTEAHKDLLRFDHDRGRWLIWDAHFWRPDRRKKAFFWALEHCWKMGLKKTQRVGFANAVEQAARTMEELATHSGDWNPARNLVACPDGVIELTSGAVRPGRPDDMIDRALAVAPDDQLPAPIWFDFLDTMFASNSGIIDFLQRWCGYCLSGEISEHKFIFMHGTGANGKGVLLNTLQSIWGDLCASASIDVFLESPTDRHPTEIARLHGTHLVVVHETREGRRWDEAKIKSMTGGDKITARFMRRDDFEFSPRFKPMFAGNHRPQLRTVDEAIRRRLLLLPCEVTIPAEQRDPRLGNKLKAEYPRILAWAVEGFRHWQRIGLQPPTDIALATDDYLANQDDLQNWLLDRTKPVPFDPTLRDLSHGFTLALDLFKDWLNWKQVRSEHPGSQKSFNEKLADKGYPRKKTEHGIAFFGLKLLP